MKQEDENAKEKETNIRTNSLDEKEAALHMMGVFAEYTALHERASCQRTSLGMSKM